MALRFSCAAAALCFALAAGAGAEPFRIIVTSADAPLVPNSVLHLAQSEGYFTRAGVDVELVAVEQTPMAIIALRNGSGDMANISVDALLGLYLGEWTGLKAVGSTDKAIPYVIAARKGLILADLGQARYGIGRRNSLDHTLTWQVLAQLGQDPEAMQAVPLGQPNLRLQALALGQIDATTASIGSFLSLPDREHLEVLVPVETFYAAAPVLTKVNVVAEDVLAGRGPELEAVLEALALAARDYAAKPELWAEAMARARPEIARETLDELGQLYADSFTVNGGLQRHEMDFTQVWLWQTEKFLSADEIEPGIWADFGPIDRVLQRIGSVDGQDAVSR